MRMSLLAQEKRPQSFKTIGTQVLLVTDTGLSVATKTRSEPWLMGGHSWMVKVEGKSGGICVTHIHRLEAK